MIGRHDDGGRLVLLFALAFVAISVPSACPCRAANAVVTVMAPLDWPVESMMKRTQGQRQAIVFVDPNDYRGRTAMSQAIEVSARSGAPFTFCFVGPADADEAYFDTPLFGAIRRMGLGVHRDVGGVEASRFGASTSGVCVAYDARGRLCFFGDLAPTGPGYTKEDGSDAVMKGLSRIRGRSDHLFLSPITGPALLPIAADQPQPGDGAVRRA